MARGTTEAARLGATWRCQVMFSVRVAETAASGDVAPIHMAVAGKARWRDWRMRRFYVPNTNLSGSCVQILR